MRNYEDDSPTWRSRQGSGSADLLATLRNFAQRQPELLLVGAVLGGVLAGFLLNRSNSRSPQQVATRLAQRQRRATEYDLRRTPSARLGATEEQIAKPATPPAQALASGAAGVTGTAYDLDPASVTPG